MIKLIYQAIVSLITAIITLFNPLYGYVPTPVTPVNPNPIAEAAASQDVTVMSYNVYISGSEERTPDNRAPKVIENILRYKPDSFGVQEADKAWTDRLEAGLTDYARVGVFRDDGKEAGESSSIFYLKDKYALIDSGNFWLSETPDEPSMGWDAACKRICTYAVLENIETGFRYVHFNVHFDHVGEMAKSESVALISKKIAEISPDLPVVLTGDFNLREGSSNYSRILESGLRDTKSLAAEADSGATYHGYNDSISALGMPIDFIFVNAYASAVASYKIDRTEYDFGYSSDHHPVIAEITLFNGGTK